MSVEQTLSIIKPDGVQKNLIGEIYNRFEKAGLAIVGARMLHLTREQAEGFYAVHRERPFFDDLVAYMTSGPVVVQALEGEGAIEKNRQLMGATDPAKADPGSIRADFATSIEENVVHGSDGPDTAAQEIAFFFGDGGICPRTRSTTMKIDGRTPNLIGLPEAALEAFFVDMGEKPFRARQVLQWIHQRHTDEFADMTDLSMALRQRLESDASVVLPELLKERRAADGTVKWLFESGAGQAVETVFIPEPGRGTLCISSQVGCALDCAFCATGAQGFNRNLAAAEIIGQVNYANRVLPRRPNGEAAVSNVVFMGMGEPLANYRNVVAALELLVSDFAYGLSRRRITVSTSGIVPQLERLGDDCNVSLAVSLHAPNDELRDRLVPINRVHPIANLLDACWRYAAKRANRFVTFEYVMLDGVNDSLEHADQLAALLTGRPAKVNLIPFNPFTGTFFDRSPGAVIARFQERLRQRGLVATTRKTRGEDIDAACGQLAGRVHDRTRARLGDKKVRVARAS